MTGDGFFLDISKIAVTFAGFTSVVGALRHPRNDPWTPRELAGFKFMIEHSVAAILIGLLPFPIHSCFSDEATVWVACSAILAALLVTELVVQIWRIKEASLRQSPPTHLGLMIATYIVPNLVTVWCLLYNAIIWRRPTALMAATIMILFWCSMQFYVFVLAIEKESAGPPPASPTTPVAEPSPS